jgi:predicted transcriptional regulator
MLFLSIHPRHVDAILAGTKRVELRRRQPRLACGDALIYASAPRMELVATFRITSVIRAPLPLLWQHVHNVAGISKREFDAYFAGLSSGVSIAIADVSQIGPMPLAYLRAALDGFHPPQGFRYLEPTEIAKLGLRNIAKRAA